MNALERVRKKYGNVLRGTDITDKSPSVSFVSASDKDIEKFSALPAELERRICAMAARWNYSPEDYTDVLERAKRDPAAWEQAVSLDEEREAWFRERGILPNA